MEVPLVRRVTEIVSQFYKRFYPQSVYTIRVIKNLYATPSLLFVPSRDLLSSIMLV